MADVPLARSCPYQRLAPVWSIVSLVATALRMAASTLRLSDSYLGAQFRRLRARLGSPKAITAMAAKQAAQQGLALVPLANPA